MKPYDLCSCRLVLTRKYNSRNYADYGKEEDEDDFWYRLYAGPQLMEFDCEELKYIRKREGYRQKEVVEAIGASVRS